MRILLGAQTQHSNKIFFSPTNATPVYLSVTYMEHYSDDYNGEPYCFYGRTTGVQRCGTIVDQSVAYTACDLNGSNCHSLTAQVETSVNTKSGDSGGPNYYGATDAQGGGQKAMGLTQACTLNSAGTSCSTSTSAHGFYTHIQRAAIQQGVTLNKG